MRTLAATISFSAAIITMIGTTAVAQDRLPAYLRANSFVTGQVLGCALRYEIYFAETVRRAAETNRSLPANFEINLIAGLDVAALKADAQQALFAEAPPETPVEEILTAISEVAVSEYDGASVGAPGYHEAWAQVAGCAALFRQFGLFEAYS